MTSIKQQLIRMVDQHGQVVPLIIRQDGHPPGLVLPGKRTRFKILAGLLVYKINHILLPQCSEDWRVNDINIGGQKVFADLGDSPEEDGVPGYFFKPPVDECFLPFTTCQIGMSFVLDVTYHGPIEEGAPFCCHLRCTAVYADENSESLDPNRAFKTAMDKERSARTIAGLQKLLQIGSVVAAQEPQLVGKWKDLAMSDDALISLVASVDYPVALEAYTAIHQILNGASSQEQRSKLVRTLENREMHLSTLAKDGDSSPDPNMARAAQGLLPAVRSALRIVKNVS